MKPKLSKVTRITIARLYSLGNYEHIRFELTAEVPKGGSAKNTLLDLGAIIARLKPLKKPYNYELAKEVANKLFEQRTETENERFEEYSKIVTDYEAGRALRIEALGKLDALGGTGKHTDAKDNWDDDPIF